MSRHHLTPSNVARHLRPSPERFAAAAALQDPSLMLRLQAAQSNDEPPIDPPWLAPRPAR
jgi:hypothetical protein